MSNYPLASSTWDDKELEAIKSVISKDNYTMGESVNQFEDNFSKFVDRKYSVMVNSGSSANLLAVAALFYTKNPKLKKGDEVIVPAVSWSTTYFPLQQYGLKLKFVDIDINTLNFDLAALGEAITDRTKMIFAVNLLGNPNNFTEIDALIKDREIILLEDNCESMGAEFAGKQTGTFGIMGTFSTFFSHHMATMEGGIVSTDDKELYHVLLSLRSHGWTRHLPAINEVSNKSDDWFEESFRFVLPGYNLRPVEMSGAIGIEQLKKLPDFLKARRENAQYFKSLFSKDNRFLLQEETGNSSWFGFSFIIKDKSLKRKEVISKLTKNNIDCRPIVTGDFTKNEVMKFLDYEISGELRNADYLHSNGFFVGNHQINIFKEIDHLYKSLSTLK
jgi:CDP-6-deoxy-D-xylo-4-hexulose-3-dehydrase